MKLVIKNKKFGLPRFRLPKVRTDFGFPTIDIAIPRVVSKVSVGGHFKKMAGVSISIAALVVVVAVARILRGPSGTGLYWWTRAAAGTSA